MGFSVQGFKVKGFRVKDTLAWSTPQEKSIDFLGISCYTKNPGTEKVLKCSTPILGIGEVGWRAGSSC